MGRPKGSKNTVEEEVSVEQFEAVNEVPSELDELKLIMALCAKYGVNRISQVEAQIAKLQ